jgi:hypothetical protein
MVGGGYREPRQERAPLVPAGTSGAGRALLVRQQRSRFVREDATTRQLLSWQPTRPTLVEDIDKGFYFEC